MLDMAIWLGSLVASQNFIGGNILYYKGDKNSCFEPKVAGKLFNFANLSSKRALKIKMYEFLLKIFWKFYAKYTPRSWLYQMSLSLRPCRAGYWPLIGQEWSRDLDTGLSLVWLCDVNIWHVTGTVYECTLSTLLRIYSVVPINIECNVSIQYRIDI